MEHDRPLRKKDKIDFGNVNDRNIWNRESIYYNYNSKTIFLREKIQFQEKSMDIVSFIECLHNASLIVDDIEDKR